MLSNGFLALFLNLKTYNYLLEPNITFNRSRFFKNPWSRRRFFELVEPEPAFF